MRYFIVPALVVGLLADASAQTGEGSFMIGGSVRISRTARDYDGFDGNTGAPTSVTQRQGSFDVSPAVGYFFIKNLMTGVQLTYSRLWTLNTEQVSNTFGGGPIVRYYIPFSRFAFFPELAALIKGRTSHYGSYNDVTKVTTVLTQKDHTRLFRAGAGIAWFVSPNIGIEGILAYQATDSNAAFTGAQRQLYFNIGLQFYLPAKE